MGGAGGASVAAAGQAAQADRQGPAMARHAGPARSEGPARSAVRGGRGAPYLESRHRRQPDRTGARSWPHRTPWPQGARQRNRARTQGRRSGRAVFVCAGAARANSTARQQRQQGPARLPAVPPDGHRAVPRQGPHAGARPHGGAGAASHPRQLPAAHPAQRTGRDRRRRSRNPAPDARGPAPPALGVKTVRRRGAVPAPAGGRYRMAGPATGRRARRRRAAHVHAGARAGQSGRQKRHAGAATAGADHRAAAPPDRCASAAVAALHAVAAVAGRVDATSVHRRTRPAAGRLRAGHAAAAAQAPAQARARHGRSRSGRHPPHPHCRQARALCAGVFPRAVPRQGRPHLPQGRGRRAVPAGPAQRPGGGRTAAGRNGRTASRRRRRHQLRPRLPAGAARAGAGAAGPDTRHARGTAAAALSDGPWCAPVILQRRTNASGIPHPRAVIPACARMTECRITACPLPTRCLVRRPSTPHHLGRHRPAQRALALRLLHGRQRLVRVRAGLRIFLVAFQFEMQLGHGRGRRLGQHRCEAVRSQLLAAWLDGLQVGRFELDVQHPALHHAMLGQIGIGQHQLRRQSGGAGIDGSGGGQHGSQDQSTVHRAFLERGASRHGSSVVSVPQDRIQRRHQQQRHGHVKYPHRAGILQEPPHGHAEQRPHAHAHDADHGKHQRQQRHVADARALRQVRGHGAQDHHPRLGIDPLEGSRRHKPHRFGQLRLLGAHRRCMGQLPRQPQQVDGAHVLEDQLQHRRLRKHGLQAEAGGKHHERETGGDAEQVRQRAHETVIESRRQHHGVVGTGRDARDGGKGTQGEQQIGRHGDS
uniref:Uncharacterized protein n=1 Tax=Tanacetum cinerariifolium TaxID=118510 RepID=A0A699GEH2_TANCI|nr:hypothetical protein [Tanacetum cinerariifolium]